jgi:amino-acid N-acetyltransferase
MGNPKSPMITLRRANVHDVDRIHKLVNHYAANGILLAKSPFKIYKNLQGFFVAEENKKLVACASLVVLWKDLAEICSLAVDEHYTKKGIGRKLVLECVNEAKRLKIPQIIALTYQDRFFKKMGFHLIDKDLFPRKLMWECLECPKLEHCDERAYLKDLNRKRAP